MTPGLGDASTSAVVAAVLGSDPAAVSRTLSAVRRQVYEPVRVVIAGSGDGVGALALQTGVALSAHAGEVVEGLAATESHVWFLREGAEPRPGALRALLSEAERVGASVAGSKLLRSEAPERLLAVGVATDVFDEPYLGLDPEELDAGQYDVVRDVAAVGGASLLVRRDLARGLGGPDSAMAPGAAAIDLCQRARLRGARVVIVPSSEVLFPAEDLTMETWREEAGRIRAMIKVYSLVTLAWALPLRFLIGLVDALVAPFAGRWPALRLARAWGWNVAHAPSTLSARRSARSGIVVGDDELFRFQVRGSARLRGLTGPFGGRIRGRLDTAEGVDLAAFGRDLRRPGLVGGAVVGLFVLFATRALWADGFPAARFSLPLPESGWDAVAAYAGGWNPAGLGSTEPLLPFIGFAGLVQTVVFDRAETAAAVLVIGALVLGIIGFVRLSRAWGVDMVPALTGALVFVAGPATRGLADAGAIPTLVGIGVLPWAVLIAAAPWPPSARRRVGRVAGAFLVFSLLGVASPLLLVTAAALVVLTFITGTVRGWHASVLGVGAATVAVLALLPWAADVDLDAFLGAGDAFWEPGVVLLVAFGLAAAAVLLAAPDRFGPLAIWGSVAAGAAGWIARAHETGAGREVEFAALAAVAIGSGMVTATVFEALRRVDLVTGWDRVVVSIGAVGATALVVSTLLVLIPGRAGLPSDELSDAVRFIDASRSEEGTSRVLFLGSETLPGEIRTVQGAGYRVASAPLPTLAEAWLPPIGTAEVALADVLGAAISGETFRVGERLAPFGIRWIVVMDDTPLETVLRGQLDLVPLEGPRRPTFVVDSEDIPVRARTTGGDVWTWTISGYEGDPSPGERLVLAEAADPGWGPSPWARLEWANEVDASTGEARFEPISSRRVQAQGVAIALLALLGIAWWGRKGT